MEFGSNVWVRFNETVEKMKTKKGTNYWSGTANVILVTFEGNFARGPFHIWLMRNFLRILNEMITNEQGFRSDEFNIRRSGSGAQMLSR